MSDQLILEKSINVFLIALLVYESVTIFKKFAYAIDPNLGPISFYFGTAIQILFGIAFSFININTKNFMLIKEDKY